MNLINIAILKINHLIFWWYYNKSEDHFKQYTIFKSISLLRQHYKHERSWHNGTKSVVKTASEEVEHYRKLYHDLKIQTMANPDTIENLNRMFGTDFTNPKDN